MDFGLGRSALMATSAIVCIAAATPAAAQTRSFDIPAQAATSGVAAFGRQANVQVFAARRDTRGVRTNAVRGTMTVEAALAALLEGTGLAMRRTGEQTFTVVAGPEPGEAQAAGAAADSDGSEEAILVIGTPTGTRLRGVDNLAAPVLTISREEIDRSGRSTIEDLFETIPQNFSGVSPDAIRGQGGSRISQLNSLDRAVGIDLRGLGPGSTLTLLNGMRRAGSITGRVVDVSTIPLSIVERVEIVTGGRSAIYGTDAVAGVVNLVTRRGFDGLQSEAAAGFAADGAERVQFSQIGGADIRGGSFVLAYDFTREWPLDLLDTGLNLPVDPFGNLVLERYAQPDSRTHSFFTAGEVEISSRLRLSWDGQYSARKLSNVERTRYESLGASEDSFTLLETSSNTYSGSLGLAYDMFGQWVLNLGASFSESSSDSFQSEFIDDGFEALLSETDADTDFWLYGGTAVMEGPISFLGLRARAALGAEIRSENLRRIFVGSSRIDRSREIRSAFGELWVPLTSTPEVASVGNLSVSAAARYDWYSDFGDTFNPQLGLTWRPLDGLSFRAAYNTAYRAPSLADLSAGNNVDLFNRSDPTTGGMTPVLQWTGAALDLGPERATTWSASVDYAPSAREWPRISLSYFEIDYQDLIDRPAIGADIARVLQNEARYPGLVDRNPSAAELAQILATRLNASISNGTGRPFNPNTQAILSVFPNLVLFDNRINNISIESVNGLDLSIRGEIVRGRTRWSYGATASYILSHDRAVTPQSPEFRVINEVGKPVDLRARFNVGWARGPFEVSLFANYIDSYDNPFTTPVSRMDASTTFDLNLRFDGSALTGGSFLNRTELSLGVTNLFDEDPPLFQNSSFGILYDAQNASPNGRYVSFRIRQRW